MKEFKVGQKVKIIQESNSDFYHEYAVGDVVEIVDGPYADGTYGTKNPRTGLTQFLKPEQMEQIVFEAKSGMIVVKGNGKTGFLVDVNGKLFVYYVHITSGKPAIEGWDEYRTAVGLGKIVAIYEGATGVDDEYKLNSYPVWREKRFGKKLYPEALPPKTVTLNRNYKAVVSEEGVTVGCSTFPLEKIKELAKVVEEYS